MAAAKKTTKRSTSKRKTTSKRTTSRRGSSRKPPEPVEAEAPLTQQEVEYFHQRLLDQRRELLGNVDHMAGEALHKSRMEASGDLSTMPIHMADVGTDNYEQEFTLGLIESEREILRAIDWALIKISEDRYGLCEGTGKMIGRARLEAKPEARYCIDYARQIEKGLVQPVSVREAAERATEEEAG